MCGVIISLQPCWLPQLSRASCDVELSMPWYNEWGLMTVCASPADGYRKRMQPPPMDNRGYDARRRMR